MWKKKSSKWAFAKCMYALPLAFIAVTAFATPEISDRLSEISSVKDIKISRQQDTLVPLATVETKPLFANGQGEEAFTRWVAEHVKYPEEAKNKGIQGKIVASFVLNSEGEVTRVKIVRGAHPQLDAEAIRVLESSPKWERPGMVKGKKVNVQYNFPLNFALKGKKDEVSVKQSTNPEDLGLEPAIFANGKGEEAFQVWVMKHVTYPDEARKEKVAGTVIASLTVTEDGSISDIKILRGVSPSLDKEVIRVLKSSPKWEKPAMVKGKNVRVSYSIPVKFEPVDDAPKTEKELSTIIVKSKEMPGDKPLYILEGKEYDKLPDIAPDDIKSIDVLKGEKAVEKYGEKAKNGVIVIERK